MNFENQPPGPEMSSPPKTLDALRREIDRIDDAIHDLVTRRLDLVAGMGALKGDGPAIRPAREAMLLRRLAARHRGRLPNSVLVRVWRELFAAGTALQGTFAIAVCAPETKPGEAAALWDLARDQYGCQTPIETYADACRVVRAVQDGAASVGVLPSPRDGEPDPWWPRLTDQGEGAPRIVARLPFAARGNARGGDIDALAIACVEPEPTGEDRALVVVTAAGELSRAALDGALGRVGLTVGALLGRVEADAGRLYLFEVDQFLGPGDGRLAAMREALAPVVTSAVSIGAYAAPMGEP
ncbi:MAG: chorismate mutase [Kiloniellales bacterium]